MDRGEIALGKHQIVPKYWFGAIGLDPTSAEDRQKFINSPELQDAAFDKVIADGEQRYPGDPTRQAANYYGGEGGASVVGTAAGDKPQSGGMPSVNSYSKSVGGRIPDAETESSDFGDFLAGAPRAPAEFELPAAPPSDNFTSFLASAPREQTPTLGASPSPGAIPEVPQPVAKGLPALQPAQPAAPSPALAAGGNNLITGAPLQNTPTPQYQPPAAWSGGGPQQLIKDLPAPGNKASLLQPGPSTPGVQSGLAAENTGLMKPPAWAATDTREHVTDVEGAFTGGIGRALTAGEYEPPPAKNAIEATADFIGDLAGQAAVQIPATLLTAGLGAAGAAAYQERREVNRQKHAHGGTYSPEAVAGQGVLGAVGMLVPAAFGQKLLTKVITGSGVGLAQGQASTMVQQMADNGKIDLTAPGSWKEALKQAGLGALFGAIHAHGAVAETAPTPPGAVPGEGNPNASWESIKVPQEPGQPGQENATPQGDPNAQREAFLNQAEQYLGPEKANAFKVLMGEYLPGGKNAGRYGVRLQNVDEVQAPGSADASETISKNSSMSMRNPSTDNLTNGGGATPETPDLISNDPSLRSTTWTGNRPTLQNEDRALANTSGEMNGSMATPENVPPATPEVKPSPFALKDLDKAPDQLPTLREKVKGILQGRKIYVDDEARRQLGVSEGGARELGPIFTKDKQSGLTLDGVAEMIREQAANGNEFYRGFGNGKDVQANDIADALFSGNQEYNKPKSGEPDHVTATNDFLRNGNPDIEGSTPTQARTLKPEFDAGGMKFKRIGTSDKSRIAYKDEYGGKYDFHPDEMIHTGGEMKALPKEESPATTPQEDLTSLFQKGPPKTSQEDMFGNKGRVASEGLIKGKGEDKGLEGTPLFEGEKRADQAKAEEDQQRLFQTAETAGLPEARIEDPKALEQAARLWKERGVESPHFQKWFGSSKVVDESGKPRPVYHGTPKPGFEHFDTYASEYGLFGQGGYFTESPEIASAYATNKKIRDPNGEHGPGVLKSYVKIDNPIDMDAPADLSAWEKAYPDTDYTGAKTNEEAYRAMEEGLRDEGMNKWDGAEAAQDAIRSMGYDGITHIGGARHAASDGTKHRVWIAFNPEQVKSATGNRGTFEPKSENMLHQGKMEQEIKGYTDFDPAKKEFVISLVNGKADVSTLFHEFFHVLEQGGVVSKADRAILTKAMEAHGITDALKSNGTFKEAAAEKVADWWERYLRDGKSPVKELQGIFDKVKNWMTEVYRSIKGTALEDRVPHSVRQVFDRLIEGGRETETTAPEEGRLAQKSGKSPKPTEQVVGPDAPRNQKPATKEDFMVMEANAGNHDSGYLTHPEKLLFGAADRAYPIKKIQKIYEKEFGLPVGSDQDLKYAINRIYGAAGSADEFINKNLAPAIEGGTIKGQQFERLQPAESKKTFEYLLARDALWRYKNTEGYEMPNNLSKKMAEEIVREHKDLAAKNPEQYAKMEKAANAMVDYARDLAIKKMEMGLWTPEEFNEITKNPNYIPEIRYWAKALAAKKGGGAGLDFATRSKLVRGTEATSENVPVFDPLTSLIHDTHQLAKEGAKHYLDNAIIDMQESSPELQKLITEVEDDYKPKAHEGLFPVRRPRTTALSPEQEKFAQDYQDALYTIKADDDYVAGSSKEDQFAERSKKKIKERVEALPPEKQRLLGKDMLDIVNRVEANRKVANGKRVKEAHAIEEQFRALPAEQQKMIKRWMKEGKVTNYAAPAELVQAMSAMEPVQYGTIGKLLKGATTLFKKGTVTWNPGFAMINGVRDVQEAYVNTGMPPHYAFKGWRDFMTHSDLYHQYLERGGAIGNSESGFKGSTTRSDDLRYGRRLLRDRFNKVNDPEAWKDKTLKIGDKEFKVGQLARMAEAGMQAGKLPMEAMEAFGHMSEMSTRLGIMRYGMEKLGMNVDQAVNLARHGTLDFDQRGASLNVQRAMDIVPFLNPRIQGTLRTGKRLMDGKQAVKTMVLGGLAPMLGITAYNMTNPNYANVSDRDKRYSWIIMIPGTDKHIAIPKPAAIQVLFNPFQMALEKAVGTTPTGMRQQMIDNMQEIIPVTDPSSILPPLAKAVLENKVNKDMFWNRPIVKEEGREPQDQYDPRTSETMKRVAAKLQWLPNEVEWLKSPERLQHISKTMLGGTADNLLFLTDVLLGNAKKALRSEYVPVVSRFYKGAEEWQSELSNQQRDLMSAIKLKERSAGSTTEMQQESRAKKTDLETANSVVDSLDIEREYKQADSTALTGRLNRTGGAIGDTFRKLGEVNKELARVRELVQAVKEHNPGVEYHFLRPPTLKKPAVPVPSGATPEASPSPEDATVPSMSGTGSE